MTDLTIVAPTPRGPVELAASVHGSPTDPAVLLLHGLSGSRDTWEEAVRRLEGRFQVWTVDFHGHGHSDHTGHYLIADYVADAEAALAEIGRPAVVAGHSLGAVVAGILGQRPHPMVRAVLLEDPPWYLGEQDEWDKGLYKQIFPLLKAQQVEMAEAGAPLSQWLEAAAGAPSPKGGVAADHILARHLLSSASARRRHDPRAWDTAIDVALLSGFDPDTPIRVPTVLIQADPELGPAFMAGHEDRLAATSPEVDVVAYPGATHLIHASIEHADRFLDQLDEFVTAHAT